MGYSFVDPCCIIGLNPCICLAKLWARTLVALFVLYSLLLVMCDLKVPNICQASIMNQIAQPSVIIC